MDSRDQNFRCINKAIKGSRQAMLQNHQSGQMRQNKNLLVCMLKQKYNSQHECGGIMLWERFSSGQIIWQVEYYSKAYHIYAKVYPVGNCAEALTDKI